MRNLNNKFKLKKSVRLAFLVLFILSALTAPLVAAAPVDPFAGVEAVTLPNGLKVITLTNDGPPVISINFFIRAGSMDEEESISGISHFCEHMFYRGTGTRTGAEMKSAIENMGGVFNAETGRDYTRYFVNLPSSHGLQALKIYSEALIRPQYRQEDMDQERKVILHEYSLYSDNPMAKLQQKLYEKSYRQHPYRRPVIGNQNTIKGLSREDLLNYRSRHYTPENTTIVLVGNFDRAEYVRFLRDFFNDQVGSPGGNPPAQKTCLPLEDASETVDFIKEPVPTALFAMAFRSPCFNQQEDVLAMDVLSFMLGKGENSIMGRELTKKTTIAREVTVEYMTPRDQGLLIIYAEVDPARLEQMKESVFTILHKVKKGKFTNREMERARNLLLKTYIYGLQTNEGKADVLGFYGVLDDYRFGLKYPDLIKSVTRQDVIRVANKYFNDKYVLYALSPPKKKE